jgi:hypothetical protein
MTRPLLIRAVVSEITRTDKNILEAKLMPYNTRQEVTDLTADGLDTYIEEMADSMFTQQIETRDPTHTLARIKFLDGHPDSPTSGGHGTKMGWATMLRKDGGWLFGSFKILPSRVSDVEAMLDGGINNVSVGYVPLTSKTRADGSKLRIKGYLDHVALEPEGAYPGAEVLAMRQKALEDADEKVIEEQTKLDRAAIDSYLAEQDAKAADYRAKVLGAKG